MKNKLIHVDLSQFKDSMPNQIDWNNVSEEIKSFIGWEYKRGYYDAQRRLNEDLKSNSIKVLDLSQFQSPELLPCPKCKSTNLQTFRCETCWIECLSCGYVSRDYSEKNRDKFIVKWNELKRE